MRYQIILRNYFLTFSFQYSVLMLYSELASAFQVLLNPLDHQGKLQVDDDLLLNIFHECTFKYNKTFL